MHHEPKRQRLLIIMLYKNRNLVDGLLPLNRSTARIDNFRAPRSLTVGMGICMPEEFDTLEVAGKKY